MAPPLHGFGVHTACAGLYTACAGVVRRPRGQRRRLPERPGPATCGTARHKALPYPFRDSRGRCVSQRRAPQRAQYWSTLRSERARERQRGLQKRCLPAAGRLGSPRWAVQTAQWSWPQPGPCCSTEVRGEGQLVVMAGSAPGDRTTPWQVKRGARSVGWNQRREAGCFRRSRESAC